MNTGSRNIIRATKKHKINEKKTHYNIVQDFGRLVKSLEI